MNDSFKKDCVFPDFNGEGLVFQSAADKVFDVMPLRAQGRSYLYLDENKCVRKGEGDVSERLGDLPHSLGGRPRGHALNAPLDLPVS